MKAENLIIASGGGVLPVAGAFGDGASFPARVVGTAGDQIVQALPGSDFGAALAGGDVVQFAGASGDYRVSAEGNQIIVSGGPADAEARIALNARVDLQFTDGTLEAGVGVSGGRVEVTLGGEAIGSAVDVSDLNLEPGPGRSPFGPDGERNGNDGAAAGDTSGNLVILSGEGGTFHVPEAVGSASAGFNVVGTAAEETVQVSEGASLEEFGADVGDVIELPGKSSDYRATVGGNNITLRDGVGSTEIEVALNGEVEFRFADGSVGASIGASDGGFRVTLGGKAIGDGLDLGTVAVDSSGANSPVIRDGKEFPEETFALDARESAPDDVASVDVARSAATLTDEASSESFVRVSGWSGDDELRLVGVSAEDVDVRVEDGDTVIGFEGETVSGDFAASEIRLVGVDGFWTDVNAFNQNNGDLGDITFGG